MRGHPLLCGAGLAAAICAACTFDESGLAGGTLPMPPMPDASRPPPDMGRAEPDMAPACDPATDPCCDRREGQRFCREGRPATCRGGRPEVHRDCPEGSECREERASVFCATPADCVACGSGCGAGLVCNVFVEPAGWRYCCVPPLGKGGLGDPCDDSEDCDTGVCGNGMCFHSCLGRLAVCAEAELRCDPSGEAVVDGLPRELPTCVP